ncbi:hypothetical protein AABB24_028113 [Solanum stoloniferum]|uniref:Uncharacterized protein n=1 Tax=Solanum stoloniferum TaxID=62892 RepID=A0ABD2S6B1_9SOLN
MEGSDRRRAVMLEAAIFGGIPEGTGYCMPSAPHQPIQNGADGPMGPYQWRMPRAPSPSLVAQCLLREQQDDEYHTALQADREKELKAKQEVEAALEEKRLEEEELQRKAEEEKEMERQLAAKSFSSSGAHNR